MNIAQGGFTVERATTSAADAAVGRFSLKKTYSGALVASAEGEMLAMQGDVPGSAAYVAMERVTGTLEGRSGSFALVHRGVMDRASPNLQISVVPDSGTGELKGLKGDMSIQISAGAHNYVLNYSLGAC
jgi:hypothetical protein